MAANKGYIDFAAVALTAATPKTVVGFVAPTNIAEKIIGWEWYANGSTSTAVPITVELCQCTFATNAPGTNSTSVTPRKANTNMAETFQLAAAVNWTAEPTVITVVQTKYLPAYNGKDSKYSPFDPLFIVPGAAGWLVRMTAPANVTVSGTITFEE